jgi:uncharacterized membrane protein YdjX (TVP38/TMEM64 family)
VIILPVKILKILRKFRLWLLMLLVLMMVIIGQRLNLMAHVQPIWLWLNTLATQDPLTFIIVFNVATLVGIPASLLAMRVGYVFGAGWGTWYVLIAAIVGAIVTFTIGRYLAKDWVQRKIQHNLWFKAIDRAVAQEGWKIVLLTRLSPIFPFNLTNYAFGVTQISLKSYMLGSMGILPGTFLYTYVGSLANDLTTINLSTSSAHFSIQFVQWTMRIVGLAATVLLLLYTNRLAKKALNQHLLSEHLDATHSSHPNP